jgi:hypothetical protein
MITKEFVNFLFENNDLDMVANIKSKMEITLGMLKDEYQKCLAEMYLTSTTIQFLESIIELSDEWLKLFEDQMDIVPIFNEYRSFAVSSKKSFGLSDSDLDELVTQVTNLQDFAKRKMVNKTAFQDQGIKLKQEKDSMLRKDNTKDDQLTNHTYEYLKIMQESEHIHNQITPLISSLKDSKPAVFDHLNKFFAPFTILDIMQTSSK